MHRSIRTAAFATTIVALLVAPGVTWAQAESEPVSYTTVLVAASPADTFVDGGGNLHILDSTQTYVAFGDLSGMIHTTVRGLADPDTFPVQGVFSGSTLFDVTSSTFGLTGTFRGTVQGFRDETGILRVHTTGHGIDGDFLGMTLRATTEEIAPFVSSVEGTLLSPKGF